jgi:arylsulfatase A-like enzyme
MIDSKRRLPLGAGASAAGLAGLVVGLVDGARAAHAAGAGLKVGALAALLAAGVDGLLGLLAGLGVELAARAAIWGRRARAPLAARAAALLLAGAAAGAAAAGTVGATALRHNRFLAAGLTALAALGVGLLGVALAPALARLAAAGRARPASPSEARPTPAAALLAPLVAVAVAACIFVPLARARMPVGQTALVRAALWAALPALVLPWALARVARLRLPVSWLTAGLVATIVYGGAVIGALAFTWNDNLRFAPWNEILAGAAAIGLGLLLLGPAGRLGSGRGRAAGVAAAVAMVALVLVFKEAESEGARKVASARAGFVGPALEAGRRLLDFDGDGYARALGGGDCDDRDPDVHPGALDLPGDGVDADCDGEDATDALPPAARMAELPPSVPADLNLLLVTIDTLRADHLGCYGYPRATSPAIDALAAAGTLFENGWAHAPSTRYSMPAIAAGRWPSAITWDESIWWPRLGPGVRTTAEALHDAGYFTGGMFSFNYFAIGDHRGFERGMDVYRSDRANLHVSVNGPMESRGSSSREMTDDAIAFIDEHKDRKFFLWLHYYDPHLAYETHAEVPPFGPTRVDGYDGEIRFTDLHFARLLEHLRAAGLWDRTAIVLTGDHGEGFGEHGVTEHGFDLYTAQTKVPFIVRVPGLPPRRVRAPVGHVDIAPTLVNLGRGAAEPAFIGRSLVPDVAGPPAADTDTRRVFQEVTSERGKKRAFVTTTRHLVWNATPGDTTECYDRTRDPDEGHDIWTGAEGDPACTGLARDLRRLVAGLAFPPGAAEKLASAVARPGAPAPAPAHPLDAAIGDAVAVRGYDLAAPDPIDGRAGAVVDATITFAVKQRLPAGWRLFFHLEGPGGFRNLDHVPVEGLMPVERWRPGQQIRDRQRIAMPAGTPAGSYTLYVGAFKGAERMPVTPAAASDGKNRLRVLTLVVR